MIVEKVDYFKLKLYIFLLPAALLRAFSRTRAAIRWSTGIRGRSVKGLTTDSSRAATLSSLKPRKGQDLRPHRLRLGFSLELPKSQPHLQNNLSTSLLCEQLAGR
jgi:hypothetical protein